MSKPGRNPVSRRALITAMPAVAVSGAVVSSPAAGDCIDGGGAATCNLATTTVLARWTAPESVQHVLTQGYATPGDGGGALWRRVATEPAHGGCVRDAGGAIFELGEAVLRPEMFGALGGDVDDRAAIQQAVNMGAMTTRRVDFLQPRYSIAGEITIPGKTQRFVLAGGAMTSLIQLQDDCPIFHFAGGNCSYWRITGFHFAWKHNQTAAQRRSYAICFSNHSATNGYWNFEISDCMIVNGFRGFGQTDDGQERPLCPVWGGLFRRITAELYLSGAVIVLRTWGRSGQPNNRIEQLYVRADSMTEPAIILEAQELAVLTSVEFNRGVGCQIQVNDSINVLIEGVRFEQVGIGPGDCYISATGAFTGVDVRNMSVQTVIVSPKGRHVGGDGGRSLIRFIARAHGSLTSFTDNPFRGPGAVRTDAMTRTIALVDSVSGGECVVSSMGILRDPAIFLPSGDRAAGVRLIDGQ